MLMLQRSLSADYAISESAILAISVHKTNATLDNGETACQLNARLLGETQSYALLEEPVTYDEARETHFVLLGILRDYRDGVILMDGLLTIARAILARKLAEAAFANAQKDLDDKASTVQIGLEPPKSVPDTPHQPEPPEEWTMDQATLADGPPDVASENNGNANPFQE